MSKMDLQQLCEMLNETKTASFLLKNVRVTKAEKLTGDVFAPKEVRAFIEVIEPGIKTRYELLCEDVEIGSPIKALR